MKRVLAMIVVALTAGAVMLGGGAAAQVEPDGVQDNREIASSETGGNDVVYSSADELLAAVTNDLDELFSPYIVPAAAFEADSQTSDYFFSFGSGRIAGSATGCFMAPVFLPDGSTVNNLFGFLFDNDGSNTTLNLWRKANLDTTGAQLMATVSSTGASTSIQIPGDLTVDNPVINNSSYSYYLTTCFDSAQQGLNGAWIFVTPADEPLPLTVTGNDSTDPVELLFDLESPVAPQQVFTNLGTGAEWFFAMTADDQFKVSRNGTGRVEAKFFENGNLQIAGTLVQASDVNAKTGIKPADTAAVLDALTDLDISTWQYNSDLGVTHLGPTAQDFDAAFGLGNTPTGIASVDADGVALAAIQALTERNAELESRIAALEAQLGNN